MPLRSALHSLLVLPVLCLAIGCTTDGGDQGPSGPDAAQQAPSIDAGANQTDAGDLLPFMSSCQENEECETGLCFAFNQSGPLCSHECASNLDCEDPSPGCNGMGICKRPQ